MTWLLLVLSLPTENATARMRAWRALKASGAAVLRDGVHLLPDEGPQALELGTGMMVIVPKGVWHRFESATGVTLMSVTPLPTDHPPVDVRDPR